VKCPSGKKNAETTPGDPARPAPTPRAIAYYWDNRHLSGVTRKVRDCPAHTLDGLHETWMDIIGILRRQKAEPMYQFVPEVPGRPVGYEQSRSIAA